MNRIDNAIQEVTALVDQGLQKYSLAHKSAQRIRELEEINREMLEALEDAMQSLVRLPDADGAYRITCIQQCKSAIEKAREITWIRKGKL